MNKQTIITALLALGSTVTPETGTGGNGSDISEGTGDSGNSGGSTGGDNPGRDNGGGNVQKQKKGILANSLLLRCVRGSNP